MPSLDAMPPELLCMILDHASVDTQRRLLLTCKGFRSFIERVLYSKVKLVYKPEIPTLAAKCPVALFFCTVRENDTLAHAVREINIEGPTVGWTYVWYNAEDDNQKNHQKDIWVARMLPDPQARVRNIGGRQFYQIIRADLVIGLLILRLKNLESLRLQYNHGEKESYLPAALYGVFLKNLRYVWLETSQTKYYPPLGSRPSIEVPVLTSINTSYLRSLLGLSHTESISCTAVERVDGEEVSGDANEEFGPLERPCNSLTRLRFRASRLKPSTLRHILAATPKLRDFEYEHCHFDKIRNYFECEELQTILQSVQETLERLKFKDRYNPRHRDLHFYVTNWSLQSAVRGRIGSLASFTRLNRLEISLACLLGKCPRDQIQLADVLPHSLQFLCLFAREPPSSSLDHGWDHASIFDRVSTYLTGIDTFGPNLVGIGVYDLGGPTTSGTSAYYKLSGLCREAGVELWIPSYERLINSDSQPRQLELQM